MFSEYNFHPRVFSTEYWNVLYCNAFSLKESNEIKVKAFFSNIFLPCSTCQTNYENYLATHPLSDIHTNEQMVQWVFNLHNETRVSKGLATLDFDYTILIYNNHHTNSIIYHQVDIENSQACLNC